MRCIFVVGPESSGCRFVTSLFIDAGCYGDSGHDQRLDRVIRDNQPPDEKMLREMEGRDVVYRQSMPHGGGDRYPPLGEYEQRIWDHLGLKTFWVITMRDWLPNVASKVQSRYRRDWEHAREEITEEYIRIFDWLLHCKGRFYLCSTSMMFLRPEWAFDGLARFVGVQIPATSIERVRDADSKHYDLG